MDTVRIDNGNTKMIAHRGLSGLECENTNAAFVAAGNRNYFGIETDVHITADGVYVIYHDDTTVRLAKEEFYVEYTDSSVLFGLTLKNKNGEFDRADLKIPTLQEYIGICKHYGKIAVLELKNAFKEEHIAEILDIIDSLGYLENTVIISFVFENLVTVKKLKPSQEAQFLTGEYTAELLARLKENKLDLDIYFYALTAETVRELHENGIKVNCWTVDGKEDADRLIGYGVDYITTNILQGNN